MTLFLIHFGADIGRNLVNKWRKQPSKIDKLLYHIPRNITSYLNLFFSSQITGTKQFQKQKQYILIVIS